MHPNVGGMRVLRVFGAAGTIVGKLAAHATDPRECELIRSIGIDDVAVIVTDVVIPEIHGIASGSYYQRRSGHYEVSRTVHASWEIHVRRGEFILCGIHGNALGGYRNSGFYVGDGPVGWVRFQKENDAVPMRIPISVIIRRRGGGRICRGLGLDRRTRNNPVHQWRI